SISGAVGGDDDFEAVGRVVLRQRVLDLAADTALFVVGGDDERHRRTCFSERLFSHRAATPRSKGQQRARVAEIRVEHQANGGPEESGGDHAANILVQRSTMARRSRSETK